MPFKIISILLQSEDFSALGSGPPFGRACLFVGKGFQSARHGRARPNGTGGFTSPWETLPLPVGRVGTAFSVVPGEVK
ncbi:hypothetical protein DHC50_11915 [Arenibacter sp. A80]|nr:hypothetical protein [Arenibacter sp. A80]RFT56084.1 hypothetical protein D0S24_11915 [Arenibacter sp. P308M17]